MAPQLLDGAHAEVLLLLPPEVLVPMLLLLPTLLKASLPTLLLPTTDKPWPCSPLLPPTEENQGGRREDVEARIADEEEGWEEGTGVVGPDPLIAAQKLCLEGGQTD